MKEILYTVSVTRLVFGLKETQVVHGCTQFKMSDTVLQFFFDQNYPIFATGQWNDGNIVEISIVREGYENERFD